MPFRPQVFLEHAKHIWPGDLPGAIRESCADYAAATTSRQKALCIKRLMEALDGAADADTRRSIMEACGRHCIAAGTLETARRLQRLSADIDDLLERLNQAHIGGGHLWRDPSGIHATYDRCYCGSVSKTPERISATYCGCSCGWFQQLFEALLDEPVTVELLGSVVQGDERCSFLIHT